VRAIKLWSISIAPASNMSDLRQGFQYRMSKARPCYHFRPAICLRPGQRFGGDHAGASRGVPIGIIAVRTHRPLRVVAVRLPPRPDHRLAGVLGDAPDWINEREHPLAHALLFARESHQCLLLYPVPV
jgi:hypothetical protein